MAPPTTTTTTHAEGGGADGYDRRRPLFEGTLPVELISPAAAGAHAANGASNREEQPLTIRVLRGMRAQAGGGGGERVLRLEVTTDASVGAMASFLYSLEVGERDFPELKRDQSLLVDFAAFPAKLVEMIQGCCCCPPAHDNDDTETAPQFRARLDTSPAAARAGEQQQLAVLSIVEATPFKELTHLALRVRPAHDGALKAYLAGRLRHTLALADEYRQGAHDAEERLARSEERARALEAATAAAAQAHAEEVARLKAAHEGEAAAARARQEAELQSVTQQRDKAVGSLQRRLEETERRRVELQELKRTQEGEIRELTRQVQALQAALDGAQAEGKSLREANGRLEAEVVDLTGERAELQRAQGMLAQQLADREESLKGARAGQEAARAGQARAEEALALYKGNALQLQERLEGSVAEIQRGNQIIAKLQAEGQALRHKVRAKGEALKQQERLLVERQRALDEAQHQLDAETREGARLRGELAATAAKLEEAGRLNESNQQVITWLNKEINDLQLGRGSGLLPLPPVTAYGSGSGKQNVSVASAGTSSSAATYTPAFGRYSAGVHDTTASSISAASSAYLLSPITPAPASSGKATKKGSGKKKASAGAANGAAAAAAAAGTTTPISSSSKQKHGPESHNTGVSTIYLDALGLADSTGSLSPLTPAAGTAH